VTHRIRWIALSAGVVVAVLGVVLAMQVGDDPREDANRSHLVGKPAPAFDLPSVDGKELRSADHAGDVVVVNFWNSWCIPCEQEHDALVKFYERHAGEPGFQMVGIVRDDTESAVRAYVKSEKLPYPVAFDPANRAALDYGTRGQPETYVVAPDGVIVASKYGPSSVEDLEQMYRVAKGAA
jgi:cytochrome c biogenesis protein CcmG/thiol:disulfide interchange protein DsbE